MCKYHHCILVEVNSNHPGVNSNHNSLSFFFDVVNLIHKGMNCFSVIHILIDNRVISNNKYPVLSLRINHANDKVHHANHNANKVNIKIYN
jgi:hypothetical protein